MHFKKLREIAARSLRDHWILYLVEGVALLAVGTLATMLASFATLGITIFLGWILLAGGSIGLLATFWAGHAPGFWWSLIPALSGIGAGLVLLT
jgi:uncharacterized membrane protein HdeD (DUF308 family)